MRMQLMLAGSTYFIFRLLNFFVCYLLLCGDVCMSMTKYQTFYTQKIVMLIQKTLNDGGEDVIKTLALNNFFWCQNEGMCTDTNTLWSLKKISFYDFKWKISLNLSFTFLFIKLLSLYFYLRSDDDGWWRVKATICILISESINSCCFSSLCTCGWKIIYLKWVFQFKIKIH